METEFFEVVWDGAHHDRDDDLFAKDARIPEKHLGTGKPLLYPRGTAIGLVFEALPLTEPQGLIFSELAALTGLPKQTVNSALYQLRQAGMLCSVPRKGYDGYRARPPQKYWRPCP